MIGVFTIMYNQPLKIPIGIVYHYLKMFNLQLFPYVLNFNILSVF